MEQEFTEFSESDKSLKHELVQFKDPLTQEVAGLTNIF